MPDTLSKKHQSLNKIGTTLCKNEILIEILILFFESLLQCNHCGKFFSQKDQLNLHIKAVHEGRKDYKCHICGKSFSHPVNVTNHIRAVHEDRRHNCDNCEKSYRNIRDLKKHILKVHGIYKNELK